MRVEETDKNIDHVDEVSARAESAESLKNPLEWEETEKDNKPEETKIDDELFFGKQTHQEQYEGELHQNNKTFTI